MYFYSDIAYASMAAGAIIARIKSLVRRLSEESSSNIDFMHDLEISDSLERYWSTGRYVSFLHTLYKLRDISDSYGDIEDTKELTDYLTEAIQDISAHEESLFDYMASRSDASFNETTNLYKWGVVKVKLAQGYYNTPWSSFSPTICNSEESIGLLSEMVNAILLAEALDIIDSEHNCPALEELYKDLKEVGAFDRWHKFYPPLSTNINPASFLAGFSLVLFLFVSWLAKKFKHLCLVSFDTWLIKRIYT